jgi:hypothetical protein
MGENLKVALAEFSTLSYAVFLESAINVQLAQSREY